jgi:hypothetical protein
LCKVWRLVGGMRPEIDLKSCQDCAHKNECKEAMDEGLCLFYLWTGEILSAVAEFRQTKNGEVLKRPILRIIRRYTE